MICRTARPVYAHVAKATGIKDLSAVFDRPLDIAFDRAQRNTEISRYLRIWSVVKQHGLKDSARPWRQFGEQAQQRIHVRPRFDGLRGTGHFIRNIEEGFDLSGCCTDPFAPAQVLAYIDCDAKQVILRIL